MSPFAAARRALSASLAGRRRPPLAILLAVTGLAAAVHAEPTPAERAAAEGLFQQARKLSRDGRHAEACDKYDESNRLDPGVGTRFYLADCYEQTGKLASAWVLFMETAQAAKAAGQGDREKAASARAAQLEPRLPKLVVTVVVPDLAGLEVRQDGRPMRRGSWGVPVPVDVGKHTVEAFAPGHKPFTATVEAKEGLEAAVRVPRLEPLGGAPSAATSTTAPPPGTASARPPETAEPAAGSSRRTIAAVAMGVGAVALVGSGFFALRARSKWSDAEPDCPDDRCNQRGYDLATSARSQGNVATVLFAVGAVGLGVGAGLWLTAPTPSTKVGLGPGSVEVRRTW